MKIVEMKNKNNEKVLPSFVEQELSNSKLKVPSSYAVNRALETNVIYSTDEIIVGRWIDGKPIYRKCFILTNVATGYVPHAHGISNIGTVIRSYGNIIVNNIQRTIPTVVSDNIEGFGAGILDINNTNYHTLIGTSYSATNTIYVILEYTKTTY